MNEKCRCLEFVTHISLFFKFGGLETWLRARSGSCFLVTARQGLSTPCVAGSRPNITGFVPALYALWNTKTTNQLVESSEKLILNSKRNTKSSVNPQSCLSASPLTEIDREHRFSVFYICLGLLAKPLRFGWQQRSNNLGSKFHDEMNQDRHINRIIDTKLQRSVGLIHSAHCISFRKILDMTVGSHGRFERN